MADEKFEIEVDNTEEGVEVNPATRVDISNMPDSALDAGLEAMEEMDLDDVLDTPVTWDPNAKEDAAFDKKDGDETASKEDADEDPDEGDDADEKPDDKADEAGGEPAADEADAKEEVEKDPRMAKLEERLAEMELKSEQSGLALERANLLRDQQAGKIGSLMEKVKKLAASDDKIEGDPTPDSADAPKDTAGEKALAEIRARDVDAAMRTASNEFFSERSVFFSDLHKEVGDDGLKQFHTDLLAKVDEYQQTIGDESTLLAMSPEAAAKVSKTLLASALADVKADYSATFRKKAAEQAETSRREVRARKKGAAGTRSKKAAPVTSTKALPKDITKWSEKQLDAAMATDDFTS